MSIITQQVFYREGKLYFVENADQNTIPGNPAFEYFGDLHLETSDQLYATQGLERISQESREAALEAIESLDLLLHLGGKTFKPTELPLEDESDC